jgi:hypothetical protein
MFIELYKPRIVDLLVGRDRARLRIAEPGQPGRYWLNLTFDNKQEIENFLKEIMTILDRLSDEHNPK